MNTIARSRYSEKITGSRLVFIVEYWAVNLRTRMLTVLRALQAGGYTSRIDLAAGQLSPLAFPEVAIAVSEIIH